MGGLIVCERIGGAFPDVVVIIAAKLLVVRQTRHRVRTRLQIVLIKVAARVSEFPTESVHPLFCRSPSPGFALAPAEANLQRHFGVSPPSVHQMVLTLERAGLIRRQPGVPRSIEVLVAAELLPVLR
jgi:IclR helix-turn-helix domain